MKLSMALIRKFKLPLTLVAVLLFALFVGPYIPHYFKQVSYSISKSMMAILMFVIPFLIFSFVFSSILSLKNNVIKFVLILICSVFISNLIAIQVGFGVGSYLLPFFQVANKLSVDQANSLSQLWTLKLHKLVTNEVALIAGLGLGIFFSYNRSETVNKLAGKLNQLANAFLNKLFMPLLPLFILGLAFKLEHEHILGKAFTILGPVFFIVIGTQITYILFLYLVAANFSIMKFLSYVRNIIPATVTGLSTSSSAATMPLLILCAEKNLDNPIMAKTVIPAVINIHTLGSAIGITILAITTIMLFGYPMPTFAGFALFSLYYALAKFGVAAVPGGVIIVVSPLMETYLGFNGEMIGLITAIYMLFDPFGTAANVTGNGVFAIIFSKIYKIK